MSFRIYPKWLVCAIWSPDRVCSIEIMYRMPLVNENRQPGIGLYRPREPMPCLIQVVGTTGNPRLPVNFPSQGRPTRTKPFAQVLKSVSTRSRVLQLLTAVFYTRSFLTPSSKNTIRNHFLIQRFFVRDYCVGRLPKGSWQWRMSQAMSRSIVSGRPHTTGCKYSS